MQREVQAERRLLQKALSQGKLFREEWAMTLTKKSSTAAAIGRFGGWKGGPLRAGKLASRTLSRVVGGKSD